MRLVKLISAALALMILSMVPGSVRAQGWIEYVALDDFFSVNFPSQPEVEEFIYTSEYGSPLPSHRYFVEHNEGLYQVTVVNMTTTIRPPGRHGVELRGSIAYAATQLRKTGEVTYDAYGEINVIPGHQLQITQPDGRRNFVQIHYHDHHLYITEAIVPGDQPPPALFQASFEVTNAEGQSLRYAGEGEWSFPDGRSLLRVGGR